MTLTATSADGTTHVLVNGCPACGWPGPVTRDHGQRALRLVCLSCQVATGWRLL